MLLEYFSKLYSDECFLLLTCSCVEGAKTTVFLVGKAGWTVAAVTSPVQVLHFLWSSFTFGVWKVHSKMKSNTLPQIEEGNGLNFTCSV